MSDGFFELNEAALCLIHGTARWRNAMKLGAASQL